MLSAYSFELKLINMQTLGNYIIGRWVEGKERDRYWPMLFLGFLSTKQELGDWIFKKSWTLPVKLEILLCAE